MKLRRILLATAALVGLSTSSWAFCGFYVASSDEPLTNKASRIVLVHDSDKTVVTMASDVHGDPKQFALVIPVPTVIKREQVRIVKPETVQHLADYTKPRLVEYYDESPCMPQRIYPPPAPAPMATPPIGMTKAHVTIEAAFSVDEYDIKVLSADKGDSLITWLNANGYKIPPTAEPVISSYIGQGMHFFVARVNLERLKTASPDGFLRPIRVTYQTPKFMLPIRLGTVNASAPQDMIVLALTKTGRVDVTNYQTVKMPTGLDVPEYLYDRFASFYDAAFDHQVAAHAGKAVFLEYAWPVSSQSQLCDPCSSPPLDPDVFSEIGVPWNTAGTSQGRTGMFITRLHVRYDREHFPEDLQFQETPDTENYQARYVIHHHIVDPEQMACTRGVTYSHEELPRQWRKEQGNVVQLTGWSRDQVHADVMAQWQKAKQNAADKRSREGN